MFNGNEQSLINQGVIQGGIISPTLFTVFVNDLLNSLDSKGYQVFAYADDIAIVGTGDKQLQKAWQIIWDWQYDNQMTINKKKSGIMLHKGKLKATSTIAGT